MRRGDSNAMDILEKTREENVPAIPARPQAPPWLSCTQGHNRGTRCPCAPSRKRPQAAFSLILRYFDPRTRAIGQTDRYNPRNSRSACRDAEASGGLPANSWWQSLVVWRIRHRDQAAQHWQGGGRRECPGGSLRLPDRVYGYETHRQCRHPQPCQAPSASGCCVARTERTARRLRLCVDRKTGRAKTGFRRSDERLASRAREYPSTKTPQLTGEALLQT